MADVADDKKKVDAAPEKESSPECQASERASREATDERSNPATNCQQNVENSKSLETQGALPKLSLLLGGKDSADNKDASGKDRSAQDKSSDTTAVGDSKKVDNKDKGDAQKTDKPGSEKSGDKASLKPEELKPLSAEKKAEFDKSYADLNAKIKSGELKANPKGVEQIYKNGGEVYDEAKLQWAINRPAEAAAPKVSPSEMPFTGPSTVSAEGFNSVLKERGSSYANQRQDVNVRREDGSISKVSLDMGQLAKLYEVKWREQGNMQLNAGALLAQSEHEINLANLDKLGSLPQGQAAKERTEQTNQWAGIKTGKGTFKCEAADLNWGQVADNKWSKVLSSSQWADKKETRVWGNAGNSMCGWFEHIGEKYVANGKDTAGKIIPQYVGAAGGSHYIQGFADKVTKFADSSRPSLKLVSDNSGESKGGKQEQKQEQKQEPKSEQKPELKQGQKPVQKQEQKQEDKAEQKIEQPAKAPQKLSEQSIKDPYDFHGVNKTPIKVAETVTEKTKEGTTPAGTQKEELAKPAEQNKTTEVTKPAELPRQTEAKDASKEPFTEVKPSDVAKFLNNEKGKDLPPIAEIYEKQALAELGPDKTPTIFVSKDGKDVPEGAKVYKSINEAMNKATAGDVIQVMPGTYSEQVRFDKEKSNITLQTSRENPAVINGGSIKVGSGTHDIAIKNFEVKNFSGQGAGIRVDGSDIKNITIAGNNVHSASNAEGIAVYGRPGVPVTNVNVIGNRVHDLKLSQLEALPINGNVDGFKVKGNSGYKLDNLFIDVIGGEGNGGNKDQAKNGEIAYNFADGVSSKKNGSYGDYSAGGIYSDGGANLKIYGNYIRNSDYGIEVASEHRGLNSTGIEVHGNIFENSNLSWLKLGYKGGVENSKVENNLVLKNNPKSVEVEGPVRKPSEIIGNNIGSKDRDSINSIPSLILNKLQGGDTKSLPTQQKSTEAQVAPIKKASEQAAPPKSDIAAPAVEKEAKPTKPETEKTSSGSFSMPEKLEKMAHPTHGQGYYQPMKSAASEILGRKISEGENRALIAAARAMRKEEGKSINTLDKNDSVLPTNEKELQTFAENIGNKRFGKQELSNSQIEKLKSEFSQKLSAFQSEKKEAPEAVPAPTKKEEGAKPEAVPAPIKKEETKPEAVPAPVKKEEERAKPEAPVKKEEVKPEAAPVPVQKEENKPEQLPKPIQPADDTTKLKDKQPVLSEEHGEKLEVGTQSQNVNILKLAKTDNDSVKVLTDRKVLQSTTLTEPRGLAKDMPVAVVPGMKPGTVGMLSMRDIAGNEHQVAFVAGALKNGKGTKDDVVLNPTAAAELGIKPGTQAKIDVMSIKDAGIALPQDKAALQNIVNERLKDIASNPEVLKAAEKALEGTEVKDKAYFPQRPEDPKYGYRRTDRSADELASIRQKFQKDGDTARATADALKPESTQAKEVIQKIIHTTETEKSILQHDRHRMLELHKELAKGTAVKDLPKELLTNLPPDLKNQLDKAEYNRKAAEENKKLADRVVPIFDLFGTEREKFNKAADLATTYAKRQEKTALAMAEKYATIDQDKIALKDRILADAHHEKAQELLRHRYSMKAYAADVIAANPDLAPGKGEAGALQGKRVVLNGGHDPFHGSPFTGFGSYPWSKTPQNPNGMSEYDFNKQSTAIAGEITQMMGGVPIYVHQDELYKTKPATQNMSGLAAALQAPKGDIIISNHMDDATNIRPGTLTLVNGSSGRLGSLIDNGKVMFGNVESKGVRQQARGIQHYLNGPAVLNELLSTAAGDRAKALDPHEVAKLQLGMMIGVSRFLNPPSASRVKAEMAADRKAKTSWDSFWGNNAPRSSDKPYSLAYPRLYGKN